MASTRADGEHHQDWRNAVALHMMYYNFVVALETAHVARNGGWVTDRLWEIADIVALVETADLPAGQRGSYRKRGAA